LKIRIAVTGSNGFVGLALCNSLRAAGCEIVPIVRRESRVLGEVVVSTEDDLSWAFGGCETVIHLAGSADFYEKSIHKNSFQILRRENVEVSARVARAAVTAGVKRVIFLSTLKVNGTSKNPVKGCRSEDIPIPEDEYALSKYEAELQLREILISSSIELVIIRSPLVYGVGVKGNFRKLISLVGLNIPLPLAGIPNRRSFIGLENLLSFIILCTKRDLSARAVNNVFLISDGEVISTSELIDRIAVAYGFNRCFFRVPQKVLRAAGLLARKQDAVNKLLDSCFIEDDKAKELLGWIPGVSMQEQLEVMFNAENV
jgi:nucleoside-diphosphate-sugar epimerase